MTAKNVHKCKPGQCHNENHLCRIVARRDIGRAKELVRDPRFFCKNCGRVARDKENLCNPANM